MSGQTGQFTVTSTSSASSSSSASSAVATISPSLLPPVLSTLNNERVVTTSGTEMTLETVAESPATPSQRRWNHVLTVGATGMLSQAVEGLAKNSKRIDLLARRPEALAKQLHSTGTIGANVMGVPIDYRDSTKLRAAIRQMEQEGGPVDLAVLWIHDSAPSAAEVILSTLSSSVEVVEVVGSAGVDPRQRIAPTSAGGSMPDRHHYRHVILGFVIENHGGSRWLTNEEISRGVLKAIWGEQITSIIGQVDPWSSRP